ncbi:MAG: Holliday junction resolvase RuvX [Candidatus Vogelbacteria bacterium]|nr:Holliday junction resolvase RuvX [Candidatus Vogelbacteria bacterium]
MRLLGIDYGAKRIGLATASSEDGIAFPLRTVHNSKETVEEIARIVLQEGSSAIVIGESRDYSGKDNPIMKQVRIFAEDLRRITGLPIYFQPEFMTSVQAARGQGMNANLDASSAAIILQAFIDSKKK